MGWVGVCNPQPEQAIYANKEKMSNPYITMIASEWADPIADLSASWQKRMVANPHISHMTPQDRGTCCAIILLFVVMLESYTVRADFDIESEEGIDIKKSSGRKFDARGWWEKSNYHAKEDVVDVFVMRDAIAHNHLYGYDDPHPALPIKYTHLDGGDNKFRSRTREGRLTRTGLSCIPGEIGPNEVIGISRISEGALRLLCEKFPGVGEVDFFFARRGAAKNLWECVFSAADMASRLKVRTI